MGNESSMTFKKSSKQQPFPLPKKAKQPSIIVVEETARVASNATAARGRLLSCPDHRHHSEAEMVCRLEKLLNQKVQEENVAASSTLVVVQDANMRLFYGTQAPKITIQAYLERLMFYLSGIAEHEKNSNVDSEVHSDMGVRYVLAAIVFVERIQMKTGMEVSLFNIHRLIITGTMIASKVLDDIQPNQKYFADLGGVTPVELTRLEAAFLNLIDYHVHIEPEAFAIKYGQCLERDRLFSDGTEDALALGAWSPRLERNKIPPV